MIPKLISGTIETICRFITGGYKKMVFLTGRKDSLYNTARVSYLLDDPKNNAQNIEDQFLHTQFFALVDRNGMSEKIYDGLKKDELEELKKDIAVLLKEPAPKTFRQ